MNYFYGGAFNPMTKAHLQIISNIKNNMNSNDFLIIGITNHNYKTYEFPFLLRKQILLENLKNIVFKTNNEMTNIKVIEQNQRTWKFLSENSNICHIRPLTIILGEDEYNDLKSLNIWHYSKEILETFSIKVISRSGETKDISATKVRELLKQNLDYKDLEKYITKITWNIIQKEYQNEQI